MADITGRVQNKAADLLDDGEHVIAALLVEPKGTYGVASMAIAALPRTSVRHLQGRAKDQADETGGLAGAFPARSSVIAVTDRRVVVIPSNGVSMKEIAVAYARTDLSVSENQGKGLGRRLRLSFIDGTSVVVDAQRGQPFDAFAVAVA
jgi:hypothetical protein